MSRSSYAICALFLGTLLIVAPSFAGDSRKGMTIDIENADGENISITVSSNLVDGIIKGLSENDMNCDRDDLDPETEAMLEHLDRKGEGSRYSFTNEEGALVKARRRKGRWEMEVVKGGEKNTVISMPWGVAECMLGRDVTAYSGEDDLEFKIVRNGGVSIRIE